MTEEQAIREFEEWWNSQDYDWRMFFSGFKFMALEPWLAAWRKYGREEKGRD